MDPLTQGSRGLSVGATEEGNKLLQSPIGQQINAIGQQLRTGTGDVSTVMTQMQGAFAKHTEDFGELGDLTSVLCRTNVPSTICSTRIPNNN